MLQDLIVEFLGQDLYYIFRLTLVALIVKYLFFRKLALKG